MFKKKRQAKKILVVDDDRSTVMFISSILKRNGYEVVTGSDGLECVEKAQSELPDLVLLDYMMPNMNGPTALAKIRALKETADIPVIMVTATTDNENIANAQKCGATSYIAKPIDYAVLLGRIQQTLNETK
jgi:CheY-like chemotaxis protein